MFATHMIPTAVLWIVAIILIFVPNKPLLGMSHHTYTGLLFLAATIATVWAIIKGRQKEKAQERARGYRS